MTEADLTAGRSGDSSTADSAVTEPAATTRDPVTRFYGTGWVRLIGLVALETWVLAAFGIAQPLLSLLGTNQTFFPAHDMAGSSVIRFVLVLLFMVPLAVIVVEVVVGALVGSIAAGVATLVSRRRDTDAPTGVDPGVAVGVVSVWIRRGIRWVHVVVLSALASAAVTPVVLRAIDDRVRIWLGIAALIMVVLIVVISRVRPLTTFIRVLAFAPLLFAVNFLFLSPASSLVTGGSGEVGGPLATADTPPLVWMVLDEATLPVIVDTNGDIDAQRFPNFARLAEVSTWYPNATAGTVRTDLAVPAALSGVWPKWNRTPITSEYPVNLFTILGGGDYPMDVHELITYLCPEAICAGRPKNDTLWPDTWAVYVRYLVPGSIADRYVPRIDKGWNDFAGDDVENKRIFLAKVKNWEEVKVFVDQGDSNRQEFAQLVAAAADPDLAGLHYTHLLIPHEPMNHLPDGRNFRLTFDIAPDSKNYWPDDEPTMRTRLQRVTSQAMLADHLVGQLLDALEQSGNLERTALVVMGDHGGITRPGTVNRPKVEPDTMVDVTSNIVMIKGAGQKTGKVDQRRIQQVDILPTVLESMGIDRAAIESMGGPRLDGVPATDAHQDEWADRVPMFLSAQGLAKMVDPPTYTDSPTTAWVYRAFGKSPNLFSVVPDGDMIGAEVDVDSYGSAGGGATLDAPDIFVGVDPDGSIVPAYVSGQINMDSGVDALIGPDDRLRVAVVVNGRVGGVAESFRYNGHRFAMLIDPSLLVAGHNRIALLVQPVDGEGSVGAGGSSDFPDPRSWFQLRVVNEK